MPLWQAYIRTYDRLGNDPYVGRRLVGLLHAAGAVPIRNTWIFFGSCSGSPDFPVVVENLEKILRGARTLILSTAHIEEESFDDGINSLKTWSRRPDAAFWFAMSWAEGRRPAVGSRQCMVETERARRCDRPSTDPMGSQCMISDPRTYTWTELPISPPS